MPGKELNLPNEGCSEEALAMMHTRVSALRHRLKLAKIAYRNRAPFEGRTVSYEDLKAIAREYLTASYDYQKVRFGRIRVRIPIAKLIR